MHGLASRDHYESIGTSLEISLEPGELYLERIRCWFRGDGHHDQRLDSRANAIQIAEFSMRSSSLDAERGARADVTGQGQRLDF